MEMAAQANDIYYQTLSVGGVFAITFLGPQALPMLMMAGLTSAALLTGFS
jgi:hypothetical protein